MIEPVDVRITPAIAFPAAIAVSDAAKRIAVGIFYVSSDKSA
jgi:hypothetical protein